jgi:hypothetical protein
MPHSIRVSVVPAGPPEAEIVSLAAMINFLRINLPAGVTNSTGDENTDNTIKALIVGARQLLERHTWRSLAKKPYVQYMDSFPRSHFGGYGLAGARRVHNRGHHREHMGIKLWYPPLISCDELTYVGLDGLDHVLVSGTHFQVDFSSEPARLYPLEGQFWPETMYGVANAVRIPVTAGYEVQSSEEPAGEAEIEAVPEPETDAVADVLATEQVKAYTIDRTVPEDLVLAIKQTVVHWYQNRDPVVAQAGGGGHFNPLPLHVEQIMEAYRCWDWALLQESD